jgi:hypothetical protein
VGPVLADLYVGVCQVPRGLLVRKSLPSLLATRRHMLRLAIAGIPQKAWIVAFSEGWGGSQFDQGAAEKTPERVGTSGVSRQGGNTRVMHDSPIGVKPHQA